MIDEIHIENLGIIEEANLEFSPNLTVITGETGAGKTMILTGVKLLLGMRSTKESVGSYSDKLSVQGCWSLENDHKALNKILDTGAIIEDSELFINRTVDSNGKSTSVIGGKRAPAGILKEIGDNLVSIHGQSDQIKLKDTKTQRESLDKFGGRNFEEKLEEYRKLYKIWKENSKKLKNAKENSTQRRIELNALESFINEFEEINPEKDEIEFLENRIQELSHIEDIKEGLTEAYGILYGDGGDQVISLSDLMSDLTGVLKHVSKYASNLEDYSESSNEIQDSLNELSNKIENYLDEIDLDSIEELTIAKERLINIKDFVRRNGGDLESIFTEFEKASLKIDELSNNSYSIEDLEKNVSENYENLKSKADKITEERTKLSQTLSIKVNEELEGLAMKGSSLVINMQKNEKLSVHGQDEIEFLIKSSRKGTAQPLIKAASGGELSRIMLALEVSLNDKNESTTLIFDEIDSGVGGATAIEIGKRLARLAQESQVIVVTHLPQVACYADVNLKVEKTETNDSVNVNVLKLSKEERVEEIARMLSGVSNSKLGQDHAQELISTANNFKDNI